MKIGIGRDTGLTYFTCKPDGLGCEYEITIPSNRMVDIEQVESRFWENQEYLEGLYNKARKGE